tara:strand:+ start:91 stop:480 length:390 start_codon:yes stop_codon:yes gene_type:complete
MTHETKLDSIYTGKKQTSGQANWYAARKDDPKFKKEQQEKNRLRREKKKKMWLEYMEGKSCCDCGSTDIINLEHDHRTGEEKLFNIGDGKFRYGWKRLMVECSKCDIRCRPCHMRRHYGNGWWNKNGTN